MRFSYPPLCRIRHQPLDLSSFGSSAARWDYLFGLFSSSSPSPTWSASTRRHSYTNGRDENEIDDQRQAQRQLPMREVVQTMRQRFVQDEGQQQQVLHHNMVWESLWKDGITPWDLGRPTPALAWELARLRKSGNASGWWEEPYGKSKTNKATLRSLIPGCGAGYDLITLCQYHDDLLAAGQIDDKVCCMIVGLDVSLTSLQRAAQEIESALEFGSLKQKQEQSSKIILVEGDFFEPPSSWKIHACFGGREEGLEGTSLDFADVDASVILCNKDPVDGTSQLEFDFIFDYTFFCALPPSLRAAWGKRTAELLSQSNQNSRLLTLMFPVWDDPSMRGPPYPVWPRDYQEVLEPHGLVMENSSSSDSGPYESPETDPTRAGLELVCWWKYSHTNQFTSDTEEKP